MFNEESVFNVLILILFSVPACANYFGTGTIFDRMLSFENKYQKRICPRIQVVTSHYKLNELKKVLRTSG